MEGEGTMTWVTGTHYIGQWNESKMHGKGVMVTVITKPTQQPQQQQQQQHLLGGAVLRDLQSLLGNKPATVEMRHRQRYEGDWVRGKMEGVGNLVYLREYGIQGESDKENIQQGKMTWTNGSFYDGGWLDGKKSGWGVKVNRKKGRMYSGYWKDGKKCDMKGCLAFANGDRFEGGFVDGKR